LSNSKIIISIILVFIVSSIGFIIFSNIFPIDIDISQKKFFFERGLDNKKKIILIGSSHVGQLNTTEINNNFIELGYDYKIFNLAYSGDTPSKRIQMIDEIISLKPSIVVYGISYRDLIHIESNDQKVPLPNPKYIINKFTSEVLNIKPVVNPKLITLHFIRDFMDNAILKERKNLMSNTPFFDHTSHEKIVDELELEKQGNTSEARLLDIKNSDNNYEYDSLLEIISRCRDNKIKIVLYLTPLNKYYLQAIPKSSLQGFDSMIYSIKNKTEVDVYDLTNRYQDMHIWSDISHIAFNKKSLIYSHDIFKIIQDELDR